MSLDLPLARLRYLQHLQFNAHIPSTVAPRRLENSERYRGSSDWIASNKAIHLWRYFFFKLLSSRKRRHFRRWDSHWLIGFRITPFAL